MGAKYNHKAKDYIDRYIIPAMSLVPNEGPGKKVKEKNSVVHIEEVTVSSIKIPDKEPNNGDENEDGNDNDSEGYEGNI